MAKKAGPRTKGEVRDAKTSRDTTSGSVLTKVASTKESSSFRDSADNFVTIPRAEFEAMLERLENLEDALAVEAFRKEFGTGPEAFIPEVVADRLLDGEVPLRAWRTYRGLTQAALGELAGVSRPMIADIET
ncbi:MAG TPA: helix-turn-helix transcriptional regulator, partial [Amaricoccus sp.]|nr:helix-turn-helix transcriptional regulator [Amaricoccus sp.]